MCVCKLDRLPLESTAETQPHIQPALRRLSAIISQYLVFNVRCLAAVVASGTEAGTGLIPSGVVTAAKAITKKGRNGSNIQAPTLL